MIGGAATRSTGTPAVPGSTGFVACDRLMSCASPAARTWCTRVSLALVLSAAAWLLLALTRDVASAEISPVGTSGQVAAKEAPDIVGSPGDEAPEPSGTSASDEPTEEPAQAADQEGRPAGPVTPEDAEELHAQPNQPIEPAVSRPAGLEPDDVEPPDAAPPGPATTGGTVDRGTVGGGTVGAALPTAAPSTTPWTA